MQATRLLAWVLWIAVATGCSIEREEGASATASRTPAARATPPPTSSREVPADAAIWGFPSSAAAADLFPRHARGRHFFLASDLDLSLDELAKFADEAYLRFAERLAIPRDDPLAGPIPVYLAGGVDALLAVERRHGFASSEHPGRSFAFRGGFYPKGPVIAVLVKGLDDARWLLGHELAHLAFSRVVHRPPDLVDEGLAELFTGWIHRDPDLRLEEASSVHPGYAARCRRAAGEGVLAPLRYLFSLDYWEFRAERLDFLHYALGWHLVRFLVEDDHPAVAGRFDRYLDELRSGRGGWAAFRRAYDAPLVERLWREELARPLAWRPLFGTWYDTNGGFRGAVRGRGSAVLLHAERPRPGAPWEIAYEIDVPEAGLPPAAGIGFVLAHRSPQDFHMLCIHSAGREGYLHHHGGPAEKCSIRWSPSSGAPPTRLALRIESDGSLLLRVDGEPAARFDPVEGVHAGEAGLMLEWRAEATEEVGVSFRDVRVGGG